MLCTLSIGVGFSSQFLEINSFVDEFLIAEVLIFFICFLLFIRAGKEKNSTDIDEMKIED